AQLRHEAFGYRLSVDHFVRARGERHQQRMLKRRVLVQFPIGDRSEEFVELVTGQRPVVPVLEYRLQLLERLATGQHFQDEVLPWVEVVGHVPDLVADDVAVFVALDDAERLATVRDVGGECYFFAGFDHCGCLWEVVVAASVCVPTGIVVTGLVFSTAGVAAEEAFDGTWGASGFVAARSWSCSVIQPPPIAAYTEISAR